MTKFSRPNVKLKRKVKDKWRKPRGINNYQRIGRVAFGVKPSIGYGSKKSTRGLHPTGMKEALVENLKQVEALEKDVVVRISAKVGKKKKEIMVAKVKEKGLRVLNE